MTKPNVAIFDVATQTQTIREMTDAEYAQHLKDLADFEAKQALEG